jgi:hypothetical protein
LKNSGRFFPGRFDLGRNVSYRIVRRVVPIDLSWWDVSYLYIYFLWEIVCIHSDIIINVTTKEVDELKIYKYYVYKTRVVPWPSLFLVRFPKCRCRSGPVSRVQVRLPRVWVCNRRRRSNIEWTIGRIVWDVRLPTGLLFLVWFASSYPRCPWLSRVVPLEVWALLGLVVSIY